MPVAFASFGYSQRFLFALTSIGCIVFWLLGIWRFGKNEWIPDAHMLDHGLFMYGDEREYLRQEE